MLSFGIGKYLVMENGIGFSGSCGKVSVLRFFFRCWNSVLCSVLLYIIWLLISVWVILFCVFVCNSMLMFVMMFMLFICMGIVLM